LRASSLDLDLAMAQRIDLVGHKFCFSLFFLLLDLSVARRILVIWVIGLLIPLTQLLEKSLWYTSCSQLYLSIFSPTRPGPGPAHARPADEPYWRAWAEILKLAKFFFGPSPAQNAIFSCLHYKMCGRPAQARARSSLAQKLRPDTSHGTGMGRIFSARKTWVFSARPEPGPASEMLRSTRSRVRGR
jgi:hypothetical protein